MTKVVSQKQRRANARNARKSTGPKTPAGKARSSRSALKHGLLADNIVINEPAAAERRQDFNRLLAELTAEFQPLGFIQRGLVERIATCWWRLRRAQRFEHGLIGSAIEAETPDPAQLAALERKREELDATVCLLDEDEQLCQIFAIAPEERTPEQRHLAANILSGFSDMGDPDLAPSDPNSREQRVRKVLPMLMDRHRLTAARLSAQLEAADRAEARRVQRARTATPLPEGDTLVKVIRYETMLDRQIHRALAELRRLKQTPNNATASTQSENDP